MITLITGKTGSGKTYYLVSKLLELVNMQDKKVYSNVEISINSPYYVYLDELGVRNYVDFIRQNFTNVDNIEEKKSFMATTDYFNSIFIIDEVHMVGFSRRDDAILNWLSIHRHFYQDVFLCTQTLMNVHKAYILLVHSHIDLIASNRRIIKNSMGYKEYDGVSGDRIRTKYFKPQSEIFELYNSGNVEQSQNPIFVKAFIAIVVIPLALYFVFHYILSKYHASTDVISSPKPVKFVAEINTTTKKSLHNSNIKKYDKDKFF